MMILILADRAIHYHVDSDSEDTATEGNHVHLNTGKIVICVSKH